MNQQSLTFVGFSLAAFVFAACGDDPKTSGGSVEDQEIIAISDKTISGVSQKGPFVNGSSVTVQELNGETLAQTGNSYEGKIKNDLGEFSVKVTKLASQYALLKANGFYRNEVTGEKSKSQVTLYALTDLSDRDEVNVNLLTHLAYERSLYLATDKDSLSVSGAKKRAEAEVLKTFEIEGDFAAAEDLNIFGDNDQSAALLAVSVLMQGNLSEGDFSERLANYAADIESDGIWNDYKTATKIADWANSQGLGSGLVKIRENITKWELSADVPAFEKYVNNFWWQNYGLGTCDKKREREVLKNQNTASANADEYYICKSSSWQVASDLEKDTYKWAIGKDAEVKYGNVVKENCYVFEDKAWRAGNKLDCTLELQGCTKLRQDTVEKGSDKVWYICDDKSWRNATTYEKDTFGWKNSTDGAIKKGNVTDTIYVFDKTAWRAASAVEGKLGGCVSAIADSVGKVGSVYYICRSRNWVEASVIEYDTYKWDAGKNGEVRVGQVNKSIYYIYETSKKSWRNATTLEKDTYDYKKNKDWADGADGQIQKGAVTDTIYVFDKTVWRVADNIENVLGGCVAAIVDSVGKAGSTYYICAPRKWIAATTIQYDTYRWSAGKDGQIKKGNVTDTFYVYDDDAYRVATAREVYINQGCTLNNDGTINVKSDTTDYICTQHQWVIYHNQMVDTRDNQTYLTVRIGKQIWMAQDLNYTDASLEGVTRSSRDCDDDYTDCREFACGCDVGTRSYLWTAAMNLPSDYLTNTYGETSLVQGVCPKGWHLPSKNEIEALADFWGGPVKAWFALNGYRYPENGDFSFYELHDASTYKYNGDGYYGVGSGNCGSGGGGFWASSEINENRAYNFYMSANYSEGHGLLGSYFKRCGMPVHCIKDE